MIVVNEFHFTYTSGTGTADNHTCGTHSFG